MRGNPANIDFWKMVATRHRGHIWRKMATNVGNRRALVISLGSERRSFPYGLLAGGSDHLPPNWNNRTTGWIGGCAGSK